MEPVTLIVTAIALGAAAGLQAVSEQTVIDAYSALKTLLQRKFAEIDLTAVEAKPASQAKQASLAEDLSEAGADADPEVIAQASQVIAASAPPLAAAIGVDLEKVKGASLKIKDVSASGDGVRGKEIEVTGDIEISNVRAGVQHPNA